MDEYSEDLPGPLLQTCDEEYLAEQRSWLRSLRGTGAVPPTESASELRRWIAT